MKKITALLLAIVMTLMAIPLVGSASPADETGRTPLEVEFVSSTTNTHSDNTVTDFSNIFDPAHTGRIYARTATDIEIIGKFKEPTQITSVVFRNQFYRKRLNGVTFQFSVDGTNWTIGYTLQEGNDAKNGACDVEIETPADDTLYSYVKIFKSKVLDEGGANEDWIELDVQHIRFYNDSDNAAQLIEAKYEKTLTAADTVNIEKFFTYSNRENCMVKGNKKPDPLIMGSFEKPTVLTDVFVRYNQAAVNSTYIEASVDGESWTRVAALSYFWGNAKNGASSTVAHVHVTDTNAYNYVRLIRDQGYSNWNSFSIGFLGTQLEPETIPVALAGYQRSAVQDGLYAIRIIAAADDTAVTSVGMKLHCAAQNGDTWEFDFPAEELLPSITDYKDGATTAITAEELGGTKLFTAVLEGIPASIGLLSVTATPYAVVEGEKKEYSPKTLVMDGTSAMAETVYNLKENKNSLKISGRSTELADAIACDFTASGIEFNATLAGDLKLTARCSGETYYTLYLNGVRQPRIKLDSADEKTYTIAKDIPAGTYNVKLVKQTHIGHTTSDLISITMCGDFLEAPTDKELFVEFIGDSITCGYGVEGFPKPNTSSYSAAEFCDATQAYAYKTALQLKADYSMVSVSGWAVLPDVNGASSVPGIYGKTSFKRSDAAYTPSRTADVVVVHLGTNDVNYRADTYETEFVNAAKAFLKDISEMHPGASIIWAYGSMMSGATLTAFEAKVKTVVSEMGGSEAGFYSVKLPTNTAAGNGHPSAEGHSLTADILSEFIKDNCLN